MKFAAYAKDKVWAYIRLSDSIYITWRILFVTTYTTYFRNTPTNVYEWQKDPDNMHAAIKDTDITSYAIMLLDC